LEDIAQENGDAKKEMSKAAWAKLSRISLAKEIFVELRNVVERLVILGGARIA